MFQALALSQSKWRNCGLFEHLYVENRAILLVGLWPTSLQYITWKQDGGGKRVIRCAATGGTGKTPPGTE